MSSKRPSLHDRAMAAVGVAPSPAALVSPDASAAKVKTGPGALMAHLAKESDAQRENEKLRAELRTWDGAMPVKSLDPNEVVASQWANRHSDSFAGPDFLALKREIEASGGNVQPIKVRPIPTGEHAGKYEVVFGHRRHKACLELGIPVFALVESVDDRALFVEMDRENRQRADLRPFEQGEMYRRALALGLFPSMRKLAEEIGVPISQVSKAHQIASLPGQVVLAFSSPLDIQFRWGALLAEAVEKAPDATTSRAVEIARARVGGHAFTPQEIFERLVGASRPEARSPELIEAASGTASAKLFRRNGKVTIEFDEKVLSEAALKRLKAEISKLLE